jgi:hypothetical protein
MQRELRFGVITIQNVPWPTLAERWQYLDEFIIYWWREDALEYGYERSTVERCVDREMLEHLATETIPSLKATA